MNTYEWIVTVLAIALIAFAVTVSQYSGVLVAAAVLYAVHAGALRPKDED